jgi:hypothetical protein
MDHFYEVLDIQGVTRRSMTRKKFICITRECKKKNQQNQKFDKKKLPDNQPSAKNAK